MGKDGIGHNVVWGVWQEGKFRIANGSRRIQTKKSLSQLTPKEAFNRADKP